MSPGNRAPHATVPPPVRDDAAASRTVHDAARTAGRPTAREAARVVGRDLAFAYEAGPVVLEVDELHLAAGSLTALLGPNGSGKSTLISGIAGLHVPSRGQLTVDGAPSHRAHRAVAAVWQETTLNRGLPLTVGDVVAMGRWPQRRLLGRLRRADRDAISAALERLAITDLVDRQIAELSGGQRRRALVAQALAVGAPVLLLDEPTAGLDRASREHILDAVAAERERGTTVVMATHDLDDLDVADHAVLVAGSVVAAGVPDEVARDDYLAVAYGPRRRTTHTE